MNVFIGPYHPKPADSRGFSYQSPDPRHVVLRPGSTPFLGRRCASRHPLRSRRGVTERRSTHAGSLPRAHSNRSCRRQPSASSYRRTPSILVRYRYRVANYSSYPISMLDIGLNGAMASPRSPSHRRLGHGRTTGKHVYGAERVAIPIHIRRGRSPGSIGVGGDRQHQGHCRGESVADFSATISTPDVMYERDIGPCTQRAPSRETSADQSSPMFADRRHRITMARLTETERNASHDPGCRMTSRGSGGRPGNILLPDTA